MKGWERKFQIFAILFLIIAAVSAPNEEQYTSWLKSKITAKSDSQFLSFGVELLVKDTSSCQNFLLFTYCRTMIDSKNFMTAIGAFNIFFPFNYQLESL